MNILFRKTAEKHALSLFNVERYLRERKALIDSTLAKYLERQRRCPRRLFQAMRYGVFSGGKRIRPILTLASGDVFGAQRKSLLPFACALEFIHAYSLIHDDLPALDDDDFRRGELSNHKVFGEGTALLAGDALLTEAFRLMSGAEVLRCVEPALVVKLIHEISRAAGIGGMVAGQALDLDAEGHRVGLAKVEMIHRYKTAALILAAVRVGACIGGASLGELNRLSRYGKALGLAFQITDDLLDAEERSDAEEACDRKRAKATYPSVVGVGAAKKRLQELICACLEEVEPFGSIAEPLRAIARYVIQRKA